MLKLSRILIFIVSILFLLGCQNQSSMVQKQLKINNQTLTVEVAETLAQMTKGLSGRRSLAENQGMLFVYPDYQIRYFHMKEMNFPLDIIWLKDNQIVGIEEKVPVLTNGDITKVESKEIINQVLEVNSGWVKENGIEVGDRVEGLD